MSEFKCDLNHVYTHVEPPIFSYALKVNGAALFTSEDKALIERIVLACNAHERLVEVVKRISMERHIHVAGQDGSDVCAKCGHDLREAIHYRQNESREIDLADARALLAEIENAKGE